MKYAKFVGLEVFIKRAGFNCSFTIYSVFLHIFSQYLIGPPTIFNRACYGAAAFLEIS